MGFALFVIAAAVLLLVVAQPGVLAVPPAPEQKIVSLLERLVHSGDPLHDNVIWAGSGLLALGVLLLVVTVVRRLGDRPVKRPPTTRPPAKGTSAPRQAGRAPSQVTRPAEASSVSIRSSPTGNPAIAAEKRLDYPAAAALFEEQQDWSSAARCHGKAARFAAPGSEQRATHVQAFADWSYAAGEVGIAVEALIEMGELRTAANLQEKVGNIVGQAELLARAGDPAAGAAVLQKAGDLRGASRLLEAAGDVEGAVALLAQKDPHAAARVCEQKGEFHRAGDLYFDAGDPDMAASMYLRAGEPERAKEIYRQYWGDAAAADQLAAAGSLAEAADLWVESGFLDKAAAAFQRLGDPTGVARALERRKDYVGAAKAFLQAGKAEEAVRVGELMPAEQRDASAFRLMLGRAYLDIGKPAELVSEVRPVVARGGGDDPTRCECYYLLGLAYEQLSDLPQAATCFEQCLAIDPKFRDAPLRMSQLKTKQASTQFSSPAAGGVAGGGFVLPQRYMLLAQIGEGAMGTVYKAQDTVLDRPVALKVLSSALADNETARSYFLREARAAAALNHTHIVTVFDAGFEGAVLYLVMEYIEGEDLETIATRPPGGLPEKTALRYAAQVADALANVHAQNIVHRDVKPGNVMLLKGTDKVKLMDFGIAHLAAPEGQKRKSTNVAGTPDFMAPEQFLGKGLGPWTDIYALGGTLYELVTGQVPFPENTSSIPSQDPAPDPRRINPKVSAATAELILACLEKDPKDRPQSAAALRDKLQKIASGLAA